MEIADPIQKIASIDTKHEAMIVPFYWNALNLIKKSQHDAQYDYYGKRLATCSSDGYIKVFDVSKREASIKLSSFKAFALNFCCSLIFQKGIMVLSGNSLGPTPNSETSLPPVALTSKYAFGRKTKSTNGY